MTPMEVLRANEERLREQLLDPSVVELQMPKAFFPEQIGLREVMCDELGRLWDVSQRPTIKMIFDPMWLHPHKRWNRNTGLTGQKETP